MTEREQNGVVRSRPRIAVWVGDELHFSCDREFVERHESEVNVTVVSVDADGGFDVRGEAPCDWVWSVGQAEIGAWITVSFGHRDVEPSWTVEDAYAERLARDEAMRP